MFVLFCLDHRSAKRTEFSLQPHWFWYLVFGRAVLEFLYSKVTCLKIWRTPSRDQKISDGSSGPMCLGPQDPTTTEKKLLIPVEARFLGQLWEIGPLLQQLWSFNIFSLSPRNSWIRTCIGEQCVEANFPMNLFTMSKYLVFDRALKWEDD